MFYKSFYRNLASGLANNEIGKRVFIIIVDAKCCNSDGCPHSGPQGYPLILSPQGLKAPHLGGLPLWKWTALPSLTGCISGPKTYFGLT
jgi:hypothetical protein